MEYHQLSREEMQELVDDPEVQNAMYTAGIISDNGRLMTQAAQAKRFQKDVTNAINDAGVNYVLPAMLSLAGGAEGIPYGPYTTTNNYSYKNGGIISYASYLNK